MKSFESVEVELSHGKHPCIREFPKVNDGEPLWSPWRSRLPNIISKSQIFETSGVASKFFDVNKWPSPRKYSVNGVKGIFFCASSGEYLDKHRSNEPVWTRSSVGGWYDRSGLGAYYDTWILNKQADWRFERVLRFLWFCFYASSRDRAASDRSVAILLTNTGLSLANLGGFSWPFDSLWTLKGVFFSSILTYPFLSWSPNPSPTKTCSPSNKSGFNHHILKKRSEELFFLSLFLFSHFLGRKNSRLKEEGWRHHHQPWWSNVPCSNHCSRVGYSCHCWLWWCHGQGQERPGLIRDAGILVKGVEVCGCMLLTICEERCIWLESIRTLGLPQSILTHRQRSPMDKKGLSFRECTTEVCVETGVSKNSGTPKTFQNGHF